LRKKLERQKKKEFSWNRRLLLLKKKKDLGKSNWPLRQKGKD